MTLGLAVEDRRGAHLAAAALLSGYLITMARDLSFYDSAELALVAKTGGVGHPIGQPLHTLLGFLFARLPGVPPLAGLSLLSALPAALSAIPILSLAERLAKDATGRSAGGVVRRVLPLVVIAYGLHAAAWEPATRVEVYALATFFALWALARAATIGTIGFSVGAALGVAASANPYTAVIAAASALPALVAGLVRRQIQPRALASAVAGGLVGLLPYVYVPLAAGRAPLTFVWGAGEPARYFAGADYAHNRGVDAAMVLAHAAEWAQWAFSGGVLPLLLLGLAGHAILGGRTLLGRFTAPAATLLVVALVSSNAVFYPDVPDYLGYLTLPLALAASGAAGLCAAAVQRGGAAAPCGALGVLAVVAQTFLAPPSPLVRTRHADHVARRMAEGALDEAPPGAILLLDSDHWVWPVLYVHEAEGRRPDVVVLPIGLAASSWYWEHLFARHPELRRIPLRGPGGRAGRIRRLLLAHPERPARFERFRDAVRLVGRACPDGWLLATGEACDRATRQALPDEVARAVERLGDGSPATAAVLAELGYERGEVLWRLGRPKEAYAAFLAGVPRALHPPAPSIPLDGAAPLRGPPPEWSDRVAIGAAERNLAMAAEIVRRAEATVGLTR